MPGRMSALNEARVLFLWYIVVGNVLGGLLSYATCDVPVERIAFFAVCMSFLMIVTMVQFSILYYLVQAFRGEADAKAGEPEPV